MKSHRRILVPYTPGLQGESLLRRAGEIATSEQAELLVLQVLDTRSGFESDGPAGSLAGEQAARRLPAQKKRLEQRLAQYGLAWAKSAVRCGEPRTVLADLVQTWRPDLIVSRDRLPQAVTGRVGQKVPEVMMLARDSLFERMAEFFFPHARGHA